MHFGLTLFGRRLEVQTKALPLPALSPIGSTGWWPVVVREPWTGAWQTNNELRPDSLLKNPTVFSCVTRISQDIGKLPLRLVARATGGVWVETTNPAYSPVLRTPNRYQHPPKFIEHWVTSKLMWGNTYVLKSRDQRGVVNALYVLDPAAVTPLVAPDGAVYYQLTPNALAGLGPETITVPAREIIHDRMVCLFHPLIGVSPLYACGLAATQGLTIQSASTQFFGNGSNPGGVLTAPGAIPQATADRLKTYWETNFSGANVGKVAVLGDGLKYEPMAVTAVDSQLIEQVNWTQEAICACFGMPVFLLNAAKGAPYANNEPIVQLYYSACLQALIVNFETALDAGLELAADLGTEFDIDDLIWMDTATKTKAAADSIGSGALSPNEARLKYFGLGPVPGGDTPYLQQQYFSLKALADRDAADPFLTATPAPAAASPSDEDGADLTPDELAASVGPLLRKALGVAA